MKNLKKLNIELREWGADDITDSYVEAHHTYLASFYSGSKSRKFNKEYFINEINNGKKNGTCFYFGVYEVGQKELIGSIKIQDINSSNKTGDVIPFIFNKKYFKYRLGSTIIKLGCKKAFDDYDLRKIFGGINKKNVGAVKTFLGSNYVIEGIRKAHFGTNEDYSDEILVACFNKKYFSDDFLDQYKIAFKDIYDE